ncbi:type II secretion system protein GspK [Anderseniella sp. Alg231-50]|uniref:type II secretion system protein GspK n=1 Tax=Anderseniella sp. Alg231-50 TaxID=1922226 RepID=UPI000D5549E2
MKRNLQLENKGQCKAGDERDAGYALVSAIWFIGFLATAAVLLSTTTRFSIQSTGFAVENAKARAYADGLVELVGLAAAHENRARTAGQKIPRNGTAIECRLPADWTARISVQDQRGLLNVNLATQATLTKYLELVLPGQPAASDIAASIVAFRKAGSSGSQLSSGDATQAGLRSSGRFRSLDELDQISGMTRDLHTKIIRFLTVHGRSTSIDTNLSPDGFRNLAQQISTGRNAAAAGILELTVIVSHPKGVTTGRTAVLDILPHPRRPFTILAWSDWSQGKAKTPEGEPPVRNNAPSCETFFAAR